MEILYITQKTLNNIKYIAVTYEDNSEIYQFNVDNKTSINLIEDFNKYIQNKNDKTIIESFIKKYHYARFMKDKIQEINNHIEELYDEIYNVSDYIICEEIEDKIHKIEADNSHLTKYLYSKISGANSTIKDLLIESYRANPDIDQTTLDNFLNKLLKNTDPYIVLQFLPWLDFLNETGESFTILPNGNILGYKGVSFNNKFHSINIGEAYVNDIKTIGHIPNEIGSTITMPIEKVQTDPAVGCSYGLHVGTYQYAKDFGKYVLACEFSPEDIASVPTECNHQKIRTIKYKVLGCVDRPINGYILPQNIDIDQLLEKYKDTSYLDEIPID